MHLQEVEISDHETEENNSNCDRFVEEQMDPFDHWKVEYNQLLRRQRKNKEALGIILENKVRKKISEIIDYMQKVSSEIDGF